MPGLRTRYVIFLAAPLLLALGAHAQRTEAGPPTADPWPHPAAPLVPGGRYLSHRAVWDYDTVRHQVRRVLLEVQATDGSRRRIQTWAPGVVKISYFAPGHPPVADSSVSVVQPPQPVAYEWHCNRGCDGPPPAELTRKYGPDICGGVLVYPGKLEFSINCQTVFIDKKTLAVQVYGEDAGPQPLLAEATAAYRRRPATPPAPDTPPGRLDERASLGVRFRLQPGERLYGTGARALPLNRRGYRLELYNQAHYGYQNGEQNLNVTLPVVLSSRGYLVLFDHYATGYLDLGKKDPDALEYRVENPCGQSYIGELCQDNLSYFVVTGQSQAEILDRYTALTGRQPLPPRWALGFIQSRFGYRSQAELLAVAARMRRENFPLDALVLDLYWFGGTTRQGDFAWDATHFPDPAGLMRTLNAQGVKTILISEPYVMRTSRNDSLVRTLGLVGTTARRQPYTVGSFWAGPASVLDVFRPATRTWLWAQYQRLHEQGAAGWWSDLGEPENHPDGMYHRLGKDRRPARQVHNAYGLAWASILQDNYARHYPEERLFNLARSGWAGMQRNSVFPWSGDVSRTWSGLQAQVPIMVGMGQAGVGYMHADAGGFGANATQDPELYTRWLQLAALSPILRPHSDQVVAPEPYTYPEPYKSIVRQYTHLRAELLPYLYTLAAENTLTGAPLVRAMDYYGVRPAPLPSSPPPTPDRAATAITDDWGGGKGDDGGWGVPAHSPLPAAVSTNPAPAKIESAREYSPGGPRHYPSAAPASDQYLLGPSLLVAPISQPGQRRRNVELPATPGGWVDFETGQTLPSGQTVSLAAPLGHIPLLVRAGAIVPTTAYRGSTAAYRPDTLEVRYYPDAAVPTSDFILYEDDGKSAQALARQQYVTVRFSSRLEARETTLTATVVGSYPGAPATRIIHLRVARVAAAPLFMRLNGQGAIVPARAWQFDANRHELRVTFSVQQNAVLAIRDLHLLTPPAAQLDPETLTLTAPASRTFTDEAAISYVRYAAVSAPEVLRIRDPRGRVVRELPTSTPPGPHTLRWDGRDAQGHAVPAGMYVAEVAGQHQLLRQLP